MRLTKLQTQTIRKLFETHFLKEDQIWLFGSRTDDTKKGGDIDFYVETNHTDLAIATQKKNSFLSNLKKAIGEQKIDIIINVLSQNQTSSIYKEAKNRGILISMNPYNFLQDYSRIADIHFLKLDKSLKEVHKLMPLSSSTLEKLSYQQLAFLDMMTTRFGKLQDIIGAKIMPLILEILKEDAPAFIDKLNRLEKLGYLEDANWWIELRDIRNQIAHDYPDDYHLLSQHLLILSAKAGELLEFWQILKIKIINLVNKKT